VVQDLRPYRRTFAATVPWRLLPEGWETKPLAEARACGSPSIKLEQIVSCRDSLANLPKA